MNDQYLTPTQTARVLGLTRQRILQLCNEGKLAHVRTPLGRLIPFAAVANEARGRGLPVPPRMPDGAWWDADYAKAWWDAA